MQQPARMKWRPVDKRIQIAVMSIKRCTGNKTDTGVIDYVKFMQEDFWSRPIDDVTIIYNRQNCHFNQI